MDTITQGGSMISVSLHFRCPHRDLVENSLKQLLSSETWVSPTLNNWVSVYTLMQSAADLHRMVARVSSEAACPGIGFHIAQL